VTVSLKIGRVEGDKKEKRKPNLAGKREMEEGEDGSEKQNASTTRPSLKSDSPFNKYVLWKQKVSFSSFPFSIFIPNTA